MNTNFIIIIKKCSVFLWLAFSLTIAAPSFANPTGGQVVSGGVGFSNPDQSTLHVTQSSPQAIVNWQDFSIQQHETTHFVQPSAS